MNHWTVFKDIATWVLTLVVACFALWNYVKNARTRRAEFLVDLHKSFFVDPNYKHMRKVLDSDDEAELKELATLVHEEAEELIDFLNFFELVAYLEISGNISRKDRKALLGYYLDRLRQHTAIYRYVIDKNKSFEHLSALLAKIK